jgi:DNA-binding MarR family transcriptional regulator
LSLSPVAFAAGPFCSAKLLTSQQLGYIRIANNYSHSEITMVSHPDGTQTLVQGFRVLQAFTASEPALTLGQVAYRTGLDSGSAFHLVQTLVMLGYVERISGSKQFRLTLKPLELGFHAIVQNPEWFCFRPGIDSGSQRVE